MARKHTMRSKEEKLSIIKQVLNGTSVNHWESQDVRQRVVLISYTEAFAYLKLECNDVDKRDQRQTQKK